METIRAIVTKVLFPKPGDEETGSVLFLAQYETPEGLVSAKVRGRAIGLRIGDTMACEGAWDDKGVFNNKPDVVFKSRNLRPDMPRSVDGAELFLKLVLNEQEHGVTSARIHDEVSKRGIEFLRAAVANPELVMPLSGDPRRFRQALLATWAARTQGGQAVSLMEASGVAARAIGRIITELREAPFRMLKENPYRVARIPDVGFDNADRIGRKLGFAPDDRQRLTAAVCEVLRAQEGVGSTAADLDTLLSGLSDVSRIDKTLLTAFLRDAARRDDHEIAIYETSSGQPPMAALLRFYVAEVDIQGGVRRLLSTGRRNNAQTVKAAANALFARKEFERFDAVQRAAVEMAATEPLAILTGGPGTGKSTVLDAVARLCESLDPGKLFLAAPTGKAAKRQEETTKRKASTVHRLLKAKGGMSGAQEFSINRKTPLPSGCVVVIDEASMLDAETASALFNALPPDGRIILVGDRNQLPSVGAGSVLGDLLSARTEECRLVPSVELVNVYRQSKDSGIAKGAVLIKNGIVPDLGPDDRGGVSFMDIDPSRLVDAVERLVCEELPAQGLDPIRDVAVLCPMAPGPGGTWQINARLAARLNPGGAPLPGVARGEGDDERMPIPRSGDRVMLTENDTENDVMNGDVGIIQGPGRSASGRPTIKVLFDAGKEVEYPAAKWRSLILAYAGTIHKSQGSQYPVVVMPMTNAHAKMLERTLVYTGWTRAQSRLILMGERGALEQGVATYRGADRVTMLSRFLATIGIDPSDYPGFQDWENLARRAQTSMSPAAAHSTATPRLGKLFGSARPVTPVAPVMPVAAVPPRGVPRMGLGFGPRRTATTMPPQQVATPAVVPEVSIPAIPAPSTPRTFAPSLGSLFGSRRLPAIPPPVLKAPSAPETPPASTPEPVIVVAPSVPVQTTPARSVRPFGSMFGISRKTAVVDDTETIEIDMPSPRR